MLNYQMAELDTLKNHNITTHFSTLFPPWQQTWTKPAAPKGFYDFTTLLNTETNRQNQMLIGCKLIWSGFLWKILYDLLCKIHNDYLEIFDYRISLYEYFNEVKYFNILLINSENFLQVIYQCTSNCFIFIIALTSTTNIVIGVCNCFGFNALKSVNQPYNASSFNDFLKRVYYYYISIILRVLYYPIWFRLKVIKTKKIRIFLTTFLTISIGGILDNFSRKAPMVATLRIENFLDLNEKRLIYFLTLAFCCGLSSIVPNFLAKKFGHLFYIRMFNSFLFFLIYSICFSLQF